MRTYLRGKVTLLFIVCAALLAFGGVALAENVKNDIGAGGIDTVAAGSSTTISYYIQDTGGQNTCEAADGTKATVTINAPAAVTTSTNSLDFTKCGEENKQGVQFSSNTVGDYEITVSVSDSTESGSYNVSPAKFTLHVTNPPPPANDPPTLSLPTPQPAEATGPNGAAVSFNATASDAQDGPLNPTCTPASGSIFPLGSTQVDCSVTDSGGLTTSGIFVVTVVDTTAPSIAPHDPVTAEATSADGAVVNYDNPTASDLVGPVQVTCAPESGSLFSLGSTQVTCTATDAHGNTSTSSFTVTVQDTTAPELTLPGNITREATGPNGAPVDFSADVSATDLVDGDVDVTCDPASGTFPIDTTTVECSATDAAGNTATDSFTVTVQDTAGPVLSLPANITTTATSNSKATVNFTATANDVVDGSRPVNCNPASGTLFSAGTTTVNCSSTDSRGNTSNGSFTVTVNYNWSGFFRPVDNPDTVNSVKAGQSIPVKFSLAGNQGLNIFAANFPVSQKITCDTSDPVDAIEETVTAGGSSLSYDSSLDQYNYVWKTDKSWAGTCRQLTVKTADGTPHIAIFKLLK